MKRSILIAAKEWIAKFSNKPWAAFETTGPDSEGHVHFSISANKAFIENLQKVGMAGQTDEETLQLFFLRIGMSGASYEEDEVDMVNPAEMPNLSADSNIFKRG